MKGPIDVPIPPGPLTNFLGIGIPFNINSSEYIVYCNDQSVFGNTRHSFHRKSYMNMISDSDWVKYSLMHNDLSAISEMHSWTVIDMFSFCRINMDENDGAGLEITNAANMLHGRIQETATIINTMRPRQNGCRFADDTFKRIFLNENVRISINISLKFVPKGPINNIPALVQIMAWRRSSDKPLSEPMMVIGIDHDTACAGVVCTAIRHSTSCAGRRVAASAGRHECCAGLQYQPLQRRPYKWLFFILPRSQSYNKQEKLGFSTCCTAVRPYRSLRNDAWRRVTHDDDEWCHESKINYTFVNLKARKISKRCVFVLVTWPWRLPEEWPVACGSLTVVGAGTMHGFGTDPIRNPTIWLVESRNQVN